jgi:hypothetical protein
MLWSYIRLAQLLGWRDHQGEDLQDDLGGGEEKRPNKLRTPGSSTVSITRRQRSATEVSAGE